MEWTPRHRRVAVMSMLPSGKLHKGTTLMIGVAQKLARKPGSLERFSTDFGLIVRAPEYGDRIRPAGDAAGQLRSSSPGIAGRATRHG